MENVKCEICGKKFKTITRTHLKTHGFSVSDYKDKYPSAETHSVATRKKLSTNREEYWVEKHGSEEGKKKYLEYKKFLADKNTFDYKKQKYKWSMEQFQEFNKSRAVTEDNLIKKYGQVEGKKKYLDYVDKQRDAGTSLDYFIDLLGETAGKRRYKQVCRSKAHTLETYLTRYKDPDLAKKKLVQFHEKRGDNPEYSSELERQFIVDLSATIDVSNLYSIVHGKQFGQWCQELEQYVKYDLVSTTRMFCIEFNGDYWHCNPRMYTSDYQHPHAGLTAKEIWDKEEKKLRTLKDQGYSIKVIWESDYKTDPQNVIEETKCWIEQLSDQK